MSNDKASLSNPTGKWWIADLAVLGAWIAIAGVTLRHHEKWGDEAQAWLIARDLDLRTIWFHELRYEGTPGLWHTILWLVQRVFHVPYAALGIIGMIFATAGVAFLLWKAPFPRPLRYLLAFSYFIIYQYAVIARQYTLLPLLAFIAAYLFRDRQHPERMALALILLANVSSHGVLLAGCLAFAYALAALGQWPSFTPRIRRKYIASAAALLIAALWLFVVLRLPPDLSPGQRVHDLPLSERLAGAWEGIDGAFFDSTPLTALCVALFVVWCWRRRSLVLFVLTVLALGGLYGFVRGWVHHQGTIFVGVIACLWAAWPTIEQRRDFRPRERQLHSAVVLALAVLLGYHVWNSAFVIRNDYRGPYSGAEDAARYLKSVGAERKRVYGFLSQMPAVEAYFDHKLEMNRPTAYYHYGLPLLAVSFDSGELRHLSPDYVIVPCSVDVEQTFENVYQPFMKQEGYSLAHFSDGYLYSKRGVAARQTYFIYRKD